MGEQPKFTDYADYLHLDTLLATQQPLSDHPDELHFIIVHQVHELWFKLAIHHLERARDALLADSIFEAVRLINQVGAIFTNARAAVEHLHTLPPASFHVFRVMLAPGSGMQSYQFREIELLAGRRDERFLKWVGNTLGKPEHWQSIKGRLEQTSLIEAFEALLQRHQIPDVASLYEHADQHHDLFMLADSLSTMEHLIVSWRQSHVQLIERTIGKGTQGTGGTMHDYLQAMLNVRLFTSLWEARDELSRRVDERVKSQRSK
jgi:tryptophan 2,3-dioxygenase